MDRRPSLEGLNGDIGYEEMVEALARLKRNKAPGADGIPADIYKLVNGQDECLMGKALLGVLNLMWKGSVVPDIWQTSTVVSIPKKGDMTDMNNYRGISRMGTGLKVLMVIISVRLNDAFESNNIYSQAQAGFRRKEECVLQAACLLEIVKRRKLGGKPTYLAFVDLKKAYDTVPHEALLAKLDFYGVAGECLRSSARCTKRAASP